MYIQFMVFCLVILGLSYILSRPSTLLHIPQLNLPTAFQHIRPSQLHMPAPSEDNANDLALFSNRGRVTASQRIKPDLVAPGTNILSTGPGALLPFTVGNARRPNTAPANFYYVDSGTSMATPLAAGAAALVRQFYRTLTSSPIQRLDSRTFGRT